MKYEVKGAKELVKALEGLKKQKMKTAIRKGSRAGSKLVQGEAKALAPARTGKLRQALKVRSIPRSRKWTGTQVTFKVDQGVFYGGFVEAGYKTKSGRHVDGKAFMRRAMNRVKQQAGEAMVSAALEAIKR